jgi:G3E family GTPase
VARLDTMVTVVDAANFLHDYEAADFIRERGQSLGEDDDRTVVDLLVDQVEFCDVLVLNKGYLGGYLFSQSASGRWQPACHCPP